MEMTITRGLAELKLLDKRIKKITEEMGFSSVAVQGESAPNGYKSEDEYKKTVAAALQKVQDLIANRKKIKDAIVLSNAATKVNVAGVSMTVAEAIEKKNSIEYDKVLLNVMKKRRSQVITSIEQQNSRISDQFNTQVAQMAGEEGDYSELRDAYMKKNQYNLVEPDGFEKTLNDMEDKIDKFESEVDYVLSESNTVTKIDV